MPAVQKPHWNPKLSTKACHANLLATMRREDEACQLAVEALQVGKKYGSERIVANVRSLRSRLSTDCRDARLLDQMLIGLYDKEQW
ncbi:hypothetical protein [Saccharopolyspora shandongensis]|uniref:hypothetical protein n=1 Tax=Saccharopolyspora shandongensis TaxID=418495 RepID=UPI0033FBB5E0